MPPTLLVNIDVHDLERAVDFYTAALGFTVGRRFGVAAVELTGGSSPVYLLAKPEGSRASSASDAQRGYARHWTPVHLDFVVGDLAAALNTTLAAGATLDEPPVMRAWGKIAHLADPFGHGLCLIEFVGRGYDEIATP